MTNKIIWPVLLAGSVAAQAVWAEDYYAGIAIGQARAVAACSGIPSWMAGCADRTKAYRVALGYQFSPVWDVELSIAGYEPASAGKAPYAAQLNWKVSGYQISVDRVFPVYGSYALLGRLGVASTTLDLSGSVTATAVSNKIAYGFGGQIDLHEKSLMRIMYEDLGIIGNSRTGTTRLTLISVNFVQQY